MSGHALNIYYAVLGEDEDLRESLLDNVDDEASAIPPDSPSPSRELEPYMPVQELLKVIGQSITICASQVCTYIAWLFSGIQRQQLTPEELEHIDRLKAMLDAKFDHAVPEHQVGNHGATR